MKIALLGYGQMGQLIEQFAHSKGHQIVAKFSRHLGLAQNRLEELSQADIALDFSQASVVLDHLRLCLSLKKPIVIGTTGWENHLSIASKWVVEAQGSCLYAPNFSIGIYLFQQIISQAAALFQSFEEYDVSGIEYHHRHKLDQPSGTAKALSQQMMQQMPRLQNFNFSSIRCGHIPGTHTLHFDSTSDTLTFTHQARNRHGFVQGALMTAEWLLNRQGFFSLDDMMKDQVRGTRL